jgi:hypothetical protein
MRFRMCMLQSQKLEPNSLVTQAFGTGAYTYEIAFHTLYNCLSVGDVDEIQQYILCVVGILDFLDQGVSRRPEVSKAQVYFRFNSPIKFGTGAYTYEIAFHTLYNCLSVGDVDEIQQYIHFGLLDFIDITNTQTVIESVECDFVCVCSSPKSLSQTLVG